MRQQETAGSYVLLNQKNKKISVWSLVKEIDASKFFSFQCQLSWGYFCLSVIRHGDRRYSIALFMGCKIQITSSHVGVL